MGRSGDEASAAVVSYRRADDLGEVAREWTAAGIDELANAAPWRTFRWHRGQKHYSGTYWSVTIQPVACDTGVMFGGVAA